MLRPRRSGELLALAWSGQDRDSLQGEPWTGVTAARRTAGRLSPAGLRLATSTTLTVAVRSGRRSPAGLARKLAWPAWPGNGATHPHDARATYPQYHELD